MLKQYPMSKALGRIILSQQSLHTGKTRHVRHVVNGNSTFRGDPSCHECAHPWFKKDKNGVSILVIMALLLTISYHVCCIM